MQLLNTGAQDQYINVSPEMSYFRQVYRRHSNFAMQSVRTDFQSGFFLDGNTRTFTCQIGRFGDLLKDVIFALQLPDIYSSDVHRFKWIKNFANYLISEYYITIGTQEVDHRWGEWMDIWNELTLSTDEKVSFDTLSGNVQEYMNPKAMKPMVICKNNKLSYSYYPSAGPNNPSLASRRIFIPLDFWFTKNASLAIPMIALQYQPITITIITRSIEDLYQVWDSQRQLYMSPSTYNQLNPTLPSVSISTFTKYGGGGPSTLYNVDGYLECNYVFLDTPERTYIAANSFDYLIERVTRNEKTGVTVNDTFNLTLSNPVKELIWVVRRRDARVYNDWGNFTASQPEDLTKSPMRDAQLLWNGISRFDVKESAYFNMIQPHLYHTSQPRQGIYVYSFALAPEKVQPSGSFNASVINTVQLVSTMNTVPQVTPFPDVSKDTEYDIIVYGLHYNVFRVMAGSGGMVFNL